MWKYPVNLVGGIIRTQRWGKGILTRKGWGWSLRTVFLVLKLRCFLVLWGGQKNIILCWAYISLTFILNQNSAPCGPLAAFPSRPHRRRSQAVRSRSLFQMLSPNVMQASLHAQVSNCGPGVSVTPPPARTFPSLSPSTPDLFMHPLFIRVGSSPALLANHSALTFPWMPGHSHQRPGPLSPTLTLGTRY